MTLAFLVVATLMPRHAASHRIAGEGSDIKVEPLGLGRGGYQGDVCEQHALIRFDKPTNELSVHDTSSPDDARIFVNDVKLQLGAKWRLKIGDTVSIAGYFFRVEANVCGNDSNDRHHPAPTPAPEAATQATALEAARGEERRVAGANRDEATTTKKNKKAPALGAADDDGFDDDDLDRKAKRKKQPKITAATTTTAVTAEAAAANREYVFKPGEEVGPVQSGRTYL